MDVETEGKVTRGMTVADLRRGPAGKTPNCEVCLGIDRDAFADFLLDCLSRF